MQQKQKCKLCRREGKKLFLKGDRCSGSKCSFIRRSYAPGKSGKSFSMKFSDYGIQLRAKQCAKKIYKINENSLKKYYELATKSSGMTGIKLLEMLETRLDNVVYHLGFATSRNNAKQLVRHGHILVNDKKIDIPSCRIKVKNKIAVIKKIKPLIKNNKKIEDIPSWLKLAKDKTSGEVIRIPDKNDIASNIIDVDLIVEFYSR